MFYSIIRRITHVVVAAIVVVVAFVVVVVVVIVVRNGSCCHVGHVMLTVVLKEIRVRVTVHG